VFPFIDEVIRSPLKRRLVKTDYRTRDNGTVRVGIRVLHGADEQVYARTPPESVDKPWAGAYASY
jgi:hypothetical protein